MPVAIEHHISCHIPDAELPTSQNARISVSQISTLSKLKISCCVRQELLIDSSSSEGHVASRKIHHVLDAVTLTQQSQLSEAELLLGWDRNSLALGRLRLSMIMIL